MISTLKSFWRPGGKSFDYSNNSVSGAVEYFQTASTTTSVSVRACERRLAASITGLEYELKTKGSESWVALTNQIIDKVIGNSFSDLMTQAAMSYVGYGFCVFLETNKVYVADPTETTLLLDSTGAVVGVQVNDQNVQNYSVTYQRQFGDTKIYSPRVLLQPYISAENNMIKGASALSENNGIMAVVVGSPGTSREQKQKIRKTVSEALCGRSKTAVIVGEDAQSLSIVGGDMNELISVHSVEAIQQLIANEYLIPVDLINPSDSNRATATVGYALYNDHTVSPVAWKLCEALNRLSFFSDKLGEIRPKEYGENEQLGKAQEDLAPSPEISEEIEVEDLSSHD